MTRWSALAVLAAAVSALAPVAAPAATITPSTTSDQFNGTVPCSLREALASANTNTDVGGCTHTSTYGDDTISLPDGHYALTIPGATNSTGDLDVLAGTLSIIHTGPGAAAIDAGGAAGIHDRVIEMQSGVTLAISGLTIEGGYTTSTGGGGIANENNGNTLNLSNSTVSGNVAFRGAGIATTTANLSNVTISGNRTDSDGGGIFTEGTSTQSFNNVTISGNTADAEGNGSGSGGGIYAFAGVLTFRNTILAGNTDGSPAGSPTAPSPDCISNGGTYSSAGNNLIGDTSSCPFTGTSGDQLGVDPLLAPLADNGGGTFTHALQSGSPAIDHGGPDCEATDQRGVPRPQLAACDVGAFELEPTPEVSIAAPVATCAGKAATIVGTTGAEKLSGTRKADVIAAGDGNDNVSGLKGNDIVCGGAGNDRINGGSGNDRLLGQAGRDKLSGGAGRDLLSGGAGKDRCVGGARRDRAKGCEKKAGFP